jgi:hypothetical protein
MKGFLKKMLTPLLSEQEQREAFIQYLKSTNLDPEWQALVDQSPFSAKNIATAQEEEERDLALVKLGYSLAKATLFPCEVVLDDEILKSACKEFLVLRDFNKKNPSKAIPIAELILERLRGRLRWSSLQNVVQ